MSDKHNLVVHAGFNEFLDTLHKFYVTLYEDTEIESDNLSKAIANMVEVSEKAIKNREVTNRDLLIIQIFRAFLVTLMESFEQLKIATLMDEVGIVPEFDENGEPQLPAGSGRKLAMYIRNKILSDN